MSAENLQDDQGARRVPVLRFKQWLSEWDSYNFEETALRRKPEPYAYLFTMPAAQLRQLCDVYQRKHEGGQAEGIQRARDDTRTGRIQSYVRYGYPFGDLKPALRSNPETLALRKPGWLPTAIVVNILAASDKRRGRTVPEDRLVTIQECHGSYLMTLPESIGDEVDSLAPFEVIDGQHRLWAFDPTETERPIPDDFELPVVAYYGLDVAWQAYLFWSINVSPKKINPSHAFDLYPLLRTQDWLERVGELNVYREARAQELTELLYRQPESRWHNRINMLGDKGVGGVSQAAWVRSMLFTFLATGRGRGRPGLYQAELPSTEMPLPWNRAQQAAFILQIWSDIWNAAERSQHQHYWLRLYGTAERGLVDRTSMLNQDQGVRATLAVTNDLFFENAADWRLTAWQEQSGLEGDTSPSDVTTALGSLQQQPFRQQMVELADGLVRFDWRSLEGPGVEGVDAIIKRSYRGSGGYPALRSEVLRVLAEDQTGVGQGARQILSQEAV